MSPRLKKILAYLVLVVLTARLAAEFQPRPSGREDFSRLQTDEQICRILGIHFK